jgi:SAM-dependent methyltransferase
MPQFDDLVFVSHDADSALFCERILGLIPEKANWRALEIGCGAGNTTVVIASRRADIEIVACDISPRNIAWAKRLAGDAGVGQRIDFVANDFLGLPDGQFDLIFVKSVLNMVNAGDDLLAQKLAANLKPDGALICVEPFRSPKTLTLLLIRRAVNLLPARPLNWLALNIATLLYSAPKHVLAERLPYMRWIPRRLDGDDWRRHLAAAGLEIFRDEDWPSTSVAKLQHRLTIYRRSLSRSNSAERPLNFWCGRSTPRCGDQL